MLENKVLTDIIEYKRETVLKKKKQISEKELEDIIKDLPPPRDFLKAVSSGDYLNVIAEIKKASPSAGIIKNDFDPAQLASEIQTAGASAISVLTEEKYFQGDLYHLVGVHQAVELPVLRKDFIIDEYQVIESRAYNADAVLLIARILDRAMLEEMVKLCKSLKMQPLVEIHDETDLEIALSSGAILLGINNRNLFNFTVDINTTLNLVKKIPEGKIVVSESGIKTREDALKLKNAGVSAILVGEIIMRSQNLVEKIKELTV